MARRSSNRPASPPADESAPQDVLVPPDGGEEEGTQTPAVAVQAPTTVRALVLLDCIYGRVNQVKDFEPAVASAAAAAGYIDVHPNAVAYGERLKRG